MIAVVAVSVMTMMLMTVLAVVHMVMIAIRVGVHHKVREDARRRPIGHTDNRRQGENEHHRPDKGNAASARSLQSHQHAVR